MNYLSLAHRRGTLTRRENQQMLQSRLHAPLSRHHGGHGEQHAMMAHRPHDPLEVQVACRCRGGVTTIVVRAGEDFV